MIVPETEITISVEGAERGRVVLRSGEYVIGREAGVEIHVEANLVSRRHARLTLRDDDALIEDLGSSNGTFVNGTPVTGSVRLWPGQKIQVGVATITLHRERAPLGPDVSLTPEVAAVRRLLPEEVLRGHKYDIGRQIAQGGMGAILTAREAAIRREIAMKVMLGSGDEADLMRFVEEAQITGQLEHPNIVPVHELGVDENDRLFYTMKMVKGITLKMVLDLLAAGTPETIAKYPLAALLTIFQKVCDAVAFAHSKGVIHRDLKPENLMLGGYGEVLVMDWGLAKVVARPASAPAPGAPAKSVVLSVRHERGASGSTLDGTIMGTPHYMAPEQARGEVETLDARADIYALGAILYHILALRPSVAGREAMEVVRKVGRGEIEPLEKLTQRRKGAKAQETDVTGKSAAPSRPDVSHLPSGQIPDSLAAVVRKAMALHKEERYASVPELQAEIAAYQAGFATSAENASLWKHAVLLVKRHKGVFTTAFAAWALITALAVWFVINLNLERRRAERERDRAEDNEHRAVAGEKLAEEQRDAANTAKADAQQQRDEARRTVITLEVQNAQRAFAVGNASEGLAWLAAVLRQDPESPFAGPWILSVLTEENFPLPVTPYTRLGKAGGTNTARSVRFSPDGRAFVTSSRNRTAQVWDAATGAALTGPLPHEGELRWADFSPDGRLVVSCGDDKTARVWDARTGQPAGPPLRHDASVFHAEFSPDGALLVTGSSDGRVKVWDTRAEWALVTDAPRHAGEIRAVHFSPDGKRIVTASKDTTARLWDARTGAPLTPPLAHPNAVMTALFSPDGRRILTQSGFYIRMWNAGDGAQLWSAKVDRSDVNDVSFSPDGTRLATCGAGVYQVRLWDAATGAPLGEPMPHENAPQFARFSADGQRLFTSSGTYCWAWDAHSGARLSQSLRFPGSNINRILDLSPDGRRLVTASQGGGAMVWNVETGAAQTAFVKDGTYVRVAAFTRDGLRFVTASASRSARLWDARTLAALGEPMPLDGLVAAVVFSADGRRLATASEQGTARIWDGETGRPLTPPLRLGERFRALHFSPEGHLLATMDTHGKVRIWNAETGAEDGAPLTESAKYMGSSDSRLVFSPDGRLLAACDDARGTTVWELPARRVLFDPAKYLYARAAEFSPDSQRLVLASLTSGARLIEPRTGKLLVPPLMHEGSVNGAHFSPDGQRVLTQSSDGAVKVWDAATGKLLAGPMQPGGQPHSCEFSPDGRRVLIASRLGFTQVWDADSAQPLTGMHRTNGAINSAVFSPAGARVLIADSGSRASLWETPTVPTPAPAWLADLAEAVAVTRVDEQRQPTSRGVLDFWTLRERLLREAEPGFYRQWLEWFCADRTTRTVSPWSAVATPDYLRALHTIGDAKGLREALLLAPDDPLTMAKLARQLLKEPTTAEDPLARAEADYLNRRAATLAPEDAEVQRIRAEVEKQLGAR
jgi:WD40 repeat protein/serine/threonine protein kinase